MALDSDDVLEAFNVLVWVVVLLLFLMAVMLPCPQPQHFVR
jgi:hypothetical protein